MISFRPTARLDKDATIILIDQEQVKKKNFPQVPASIKSDVSAIIQQGNFSGDSGELFPLVVKKNLVILAGAGKKDESSTALRINVRNAIACGYLKKAKTIELIPHRRDDTVVISAIEGFLIGTYVWRKYISKSENDKTVEHKSLTVAAPGKKIYEDAATICEGVTLARNLVNENADVKTSTYLESTIKGLVKGKKNLSVEILNRAQLKAKGLNLHLAVNQGSINEPKLIIVKYNGAGKSGNDTALVGKGITFDTGGLNIKPTGSMETMRCDMSGAAAVIGTLRNTLDLKLKKNVLFVVGIAENAIGARAYKPGDVFRGYAGKTVEIGNTDAEGRLVLADAISYVVKNYKPSRLIDVATLTGACVVALGHDYTGMITNNDDLSRDLVHASNETDDRLWRLPSYPEIKDYVKSNIADLKNTSTLRGAGGAITAAEFLRQFTGGIPWAHLDIAGTAFNDGKSRFYFGHGATGAGVRLLTRYLTNS